jgi:hypothetical protein
VVALAIPAIILVVMLLAPRLRRRVPTHLSGSRDFPRASGSRDSRV